MEAVFIYIAKSSSLMLMFYCAYYFLLRKETFFNSNRWFLLSGLVVSVILPLLTYTKVIWIDAAPNFDTNIQTTLINNSDSESVEFNWNYIILGFYGIGLLVFLLKLAIDFYSLNAIIKGKKIKQQADFKFVDINENIAPFSYFEYIVYNSSLYTASELESILEHEKVHSDQNHTFDVLISRIFSIIFWFNPIVWFYKKAITQNLEFIADSEASKKLSDKKAYQYTLLKITTHENCVAITNHFYQSLIKKRIVMLNKNQSKKRNSWKYYLMLPAIATFVLLFQVEVIAKEKPQIIKENDSNIESVDVFKISKNSTDAELNKIKNNLKKNHNVKFEMSEVKRNDSDQLTSITVDIKKGKQHSKSIQNSDKAINEFGVIIITYKNGDKKIGIQTVNNSNNKEPKKVISNKLKTETNVNTNSNTSTKTNSNSSANSSTTVIIDKDNNTVITTSSDEGTSVAVANGVKTNVKIGFPLVILDGKDMPSDFDMNSLPPSTIKSVRVFKSLDAVALFGEKGENGIVEIKSKK